MERLLKILTSAPERVAIQYNRDNEWIDITYRELETKIKALSSFLLEKGIKKGQRKL